MVRKITVYGKNVTKAEKKLKEQHRNAFIVSAIVKYKPEKFRKTGIADTVKNAFKRAEFKIPKMLKKKERIVKRKQRLINYLVNTIDENSAIGIIVNKLLDECIIGSLEYMDQSYNVTVTLTKKGRKGLLGVGSKHNTYSVNVFLKAMVEIVYETMARAEAEITTSENVANKAFLLAAENRDIKLAESLLKQGVNVNYVNSQGANALMLAAFNGCIPLSFSLLTSKIDIQKQDNDGFNALMLTCESGSPHLGLLKLLIDLGADVNTKSNLGSTALMSAAKSGHLHLVELLVTNGAEVNVANTDHNTTPLIWAATKGHLHIVKVLMDNGADKSVLTFNNYTAATIAKENGHYDIVNLLDQY